MNKKTSNNDSPQPFLFDPLPIPAPRMPNPGSQAWYVANAFMQGRRLTQIDCLDMGLGWRLAAHIQRLKLMGWPVEDIRLLGLIKQYFITPENIRAIWEAWQHEKQT